MLQCIAMFIIPRLRGFFHILNYAGVMDRRLFSYEDFVLFESDARSLANANCWLTDNVVNFAVSYLYNQSAEQYPRIINSVSVVSATLCELIKYTEENEMDALLQSIGATSQKWLLFLFNDSTEPQIALSGTHWSLVLFNPHCRHFILFDPMSQSLSSRDAGNVYKFVLKLATSFGCRRSVGEEQKGGHQLLVSSLVHPIMQTPGDCGIFVVEYSRAILEALSRNAQSGAEVDFDFSHINPGDMGSTRRHWMEIIRKQEQTAINNR